MNKTEGVDNERARIEDLLIEVEQIMNSDPQQALNLSQQALHFAEAYGSKGLIGYSHVRRSEAFMRVTKIEVSELHAIKALSIAKEINDPILECNALHSLSTVKMKFADYPAMVELLSQEIKTAELIHDNIIRRKVKLFASIGLAMSYIDLGDIEKAFELASNQLENAKESPNIIDSAYILNVLGHITERSEDYFGAAQYYKKALVLAEAEHNQPLLFTIYLRLGNICKQDKAVEKKEWAEKCLAAARESASSHQIANALYLKGEGHKYLSEYEEALTCFHETEKLYESIAHSYVTHIGIYIEMAEIYFRMNDRLQAEVMLQKIDADWENTCPEIVKIEVLKGLSVVYSLKGDFEQAYRCLARSEEIKNSYYTEKVKTNLDNHRIALKQERDKHQEEMHRLHYETLEKQITLQAQQLATQTELLAKFRDELREIVRRSESTDPTIREIKTKLKELPCKQIDWERFETEFKSVHPEFTRKLQEKFPTLTMSESKMCSLVRLNLKSSEIARLFCLSERSVETHRFNIRRKLGIERDQSLGEFLNSL